MTPETHSTAAAAADPARFLRLAGSHYENFPVGSFLVPRRARRHLHRIYAFARIADDLADEHGDAPALSAMGEALRQHLAGEAREPVPLMSELTETIAALELPQELFFDLLDAFTEDLELRRHDEKSLFSYCRRSADPIGRLMLRVFGHRDEHKDRLSDRVCTALQILNHLQDIKEDLLERDRIYLPLEDLARHGLCEEDLRAEKASPAVKALVAEWADRVASMFAEGWELTGLVRGRLRLELRAILQGAAAVLRKIRAIDHDVLSSHVRLGRRDKVLALLRALSSSRMPGEFG